MNNAKILLPNLKNSDFSNLISKKFNDRPFNNSYPFNLGINTNSLENSDTETSSNSTNIPVATYNPNTFVNTTNIMENPVMPSIARISMPVVLNNTETKISLAPVVNTQVTKNSYLPKNGDVVEIKSKKHKYGHTASYYNGFWFSDFKSKNINVYSDDPDAKIRIFRNPDRAEAEKSSEIIASRAGKTSKHQCAKYVRTGLNLASKGKYTSEGYNGNVFGDYLSKKGWVLVAKVGIKVPEIYSESIYNSNLPISAYNPTLNPTANPTVLIPEIVTSLNPIKYNLPTIETPKENQIEVPVSLNAAEKTPDFSIQKLSTFTKGDPKSFMNYAILTYKNLGISNTHAVVLAAQDALESGYGAKVSGKNNYGGIKSSKGTVKSTTEHVNGKNIKTHGTFRDFTDYLDYAEYHKNLLGNSRYNIFSTQSVDGIINKIYKGGYATDPNYFLKLKSLVNKYL